MLVLTTNSFNKDISKIKDKKVTTKIEQAIRKMETVNAVSELAGVKKLSGHSHAYRIRIGDYRLGFFLIENSIRLTVFAHRKDIYKFFP
jgi:mRNA interferase RelE/StbE